MTTILIASHNAGKIADFKALFQSYDIKVESLLDYPELPDVEETGTTFAENALLKARTIAKEAGRITLADDSGLVVPSLNGEPGIYSARYAGVHGDDAANNAKLLERMAGMTGADRRAFFVSVIAVYDPATGDDLVAEGKVRGLILDEAQGEGGFGYDPLFYYPELKQSFGELTLDEKNKVSHRQEALKVLMNQFPDWMKGRKQS